MEKTLCPYCHQSVMKHKHIFSENLAHILLKVAKIWPPGKGFHLAKDVELTAFQYTNFQKLCYWGLAEKHYESKVENGRIAKKRKGGYWHLTEKAMHVLSGHAIPKFVVTFNGEIVEKSEETIIMKEVIGYYDIPATWAKRAQPMDFSKEKQQELFDNKVLV